MKKRITSLCVAVALLFTMLPQLMLTADATKTDSGKLGENLTWELKNGVLTISGAGNMCDFYTLSEDQLGHTTSPWDPYQDEITSVVVMPGVTSIGQQAFYFCKRIEEITIPNGMSRIGNWAFANCESLQSINLPDSIISIGEYAFTGCENLSELVLPNQLTTISTGLFDGCRKLTVTLSASIESIDSKGEHLGLSSCEKILVDPDNPYFSADADGVLYNKDKTELIRVPGSLLEFTIPQSVKRVGDYACAYSNLQEVFIPETVTSIGEHAFTQSDLIHLDIPGNVKEIGRNAFFNCEDLAELSISEGVESLGIASFAACLQLSDVHIPKSVCNIGAAAFAYCYAADGIWVDTDNQYYSNDSLGALYNKDKTELLQAPCWTQSTDYSIPQSVCNIGAEAFGGYETLTSIVIPPNVQSLDEVAFVSCYNLKEVFFMGNAPTIKDECFQWVNATVYYPKDNGTWTEAIMQNYGGELTWVAADIPNFYGFNLNKDGWSFANSSFSFREDAESPFSSYYIPEERYDEVFGTAYLDSNKFSKKWGGNCAGMSTTAILFFLDYLNWQTIDDGYPNDFSTPNSFYQTINYHYASQSGYAAIGNDTEVTRLIEAYQLYVNEIDRSEYEALLDDTYHAEEFTKDGIFSYYTQEHLSNGTYISSMLEVFSRAYEENTPLYISLKGDDFGHAIVSRTDKKTEDMGNGWWRVYVYDPNKPYLNDSITEKFWETYPDANLKDACNDLDEDVYLELNPSQNLWRYCTSVNSDSSSKYLGCNLNNEVLYIKCDAKDGKGNKLTVKIPEYFYTIDLHDIQISDYVHPSTTAWMPENTDDGCIISVDGSSDCLVYSSSGTLIAVIENGEAIVLNGDGYYVGYTGEAEESTPVGGKLYLPSDTYTVQYTSGQMAFLGSSNVISVSGETAMDLIVDVAENSVQIMADNDGTVSIKCSNVISADKCSYVETEGTLVAGETFTIAYSDENKVEASTNSKDGEFQLYQKDADQEEGVATKVVKASSLWWLWSVGGVAVAGVVLFILLKKKKPNA